MKHVFVETNFLIELTRPLPSPKAEHAARLCERAARQELTLHLPWCSVVEAKRALVGKIHEDLGFTTKMMKFAIQAFTTRTAQFDKREIDKLDKQVRTARIDAITKINQRIDDIAKQISLIRPTEAVVTKTLNLFDVKSMKPFDEMVLGAVLQKASELYQDGERDLWFCNLNTNDFEPDPVSRPQLDAEYKAYGLQYLASFDVP